MPKGGSVEGNVTHEETNRSEGAGVKMIQNSASGFTLPEIKKERGGGGGEKAGKEGQAALL